MKQRYQILTALLFILLSGATAYAQKTISGTVLDSDGKGMPGVNVIVKGTSSGTTSDADGKYTLTADNNATTLVFSFIGYANQESEIGNRTTVDVTMAEDVRQLNEVVVTALGVERSTKALQSSITTVNGDNLTQAREISAGNALAGRVAGVNVSKIASGPAGSSRVVIRGAKTLGSTLNQPLYVVDGVPMDNTNFGQAGVWGGADQGDGLSSINPDDIASMTVLKGASAAALYGSRAANGVIIITTKKGSARKGIGVELNSNYVMETINNLTDFQHDYGNGGYIGTTLQNSTAQTPTTIDQHWNNGWGLNGWGPKMDGHPVVQWDGVTRPYSYQGDNWKRFYNTGSTFTNTIALTGGSETQNFRFSVSDLKNKGTIPNSAYDRVNLSLATNSKFGKRLTLTSKILYSNEKVKNRPNVSDSPGNGILAMYYVPNDVNVNNLKGDPNKLGAVPTLEQQTAQGVSIFDGKAPGEEFQVSTNLWSQNPWWTAYQFKNSDVKDRIITSGQLRYDFTDFLYAQVKGGMDWFTKRGSQLTPQGTGYNRAGSISENEFRTREINLEYTVGFNKSFIESKFNVNAFVGGNRMRRSNESMAINGSGFNTPFFPAISNGATKTFDYGFGESGINSLFGSLELSWNNYLFLTGTVRKDWFSVLNPAKNAITYPSIGGSFVFSDALTNLPSWISFGKIRASWAQVGNVQSVDPYSTTLTYSASLTHLGHPLGGLTSGTNFPNPDLVPYLSSEYEEGIDVRFFDNRLGLDLTRYDQSTSNDILNQNISWGSGYRTTSVNLGKLTNKGWEVLLTGTPLKGDLTWDVSLNFAKNTSKVVRLVDGQTELVGEEPRTRTVYIKNIVGQPFGTITGQVQQIDPASGLPIFNADGAPITDGSYKIIGHGVPNFTGGITNTFSYKSFNLSFLIDFKQGGDIYSGTNVRMTQAGFTKQTLQGREGEAPLTVTGVTEVLDGGGNGTGVYEPFTKTLTPGEANNYWGTSGDRQADKFVYDASFAKLRQITFGYSFPRTMLTKTPFQSLMLSFVARNLAILYKNTPNIDPESSYTSSNSQGLDYFGMPATRTYGFNLRVTF